MYLKGTMSAITLPFLVYAAREGYGWVNGCTVPIALREQLRRTAGKMPDFDMQGAPGTCGVVNVGEWVLAYRFMRQIAGDSRGRDCAYLAMSYVKASEAGEINADALLLEPLFKTPQKTPPDTIAYAGGKGPGTAWQVPSQSGCGMFDARGSLSAACGAVGGVTEGTLRISRSEPEDGRGSRFEYVKKTEPQSPVVRKPGRETVVSGPDETAVRGKAQGCPWRLVGLLVIWALLLGVLIGRLLPWLGVLIGRSLT